MNKKAKFSDVNIEHIDEYLYNLQYLTQDFCNFFGESTELARYFPEMLTNF